MKSRADIAENPEDGADGGLRIVIAGGGTGGHLFPGIAIAEAFQARSAESRMLFITTGRPIEERVLATGTYATCRITAAGFKGVGPVGKLKALFKVPAGLIAALLLLVRFRPHAVIGMGAYSAAPVITAAWMLRIFRAIHEQNCIAGMTNRFLGRFANRIYVSFPDTAIGGSPEKILFTGNPIRGEIAQAQAQAEEVPEAGAKPFTVLILGGSQGAHAINLSIMAALAHLQASEWAARIRFIHQTGAADCEMVREAYAKAGIEARVEAFFDDMAACYAAADLIICRAGATSVAEVAAVGLPAVFIPYPHAADNHQYFNAKSLVDAGAAEMIGQEEAEGHVLTERILFYAENEDTRSRMQAAIRAFSRPDAANAIVSDICRALGLSGAHENTDV